MIQANLTSVEHQKVMVMKTTDNRQWSLPRMALSSAASFDFPAVRLVVSCAEKSCLGVKSMGVLGQKYGTFES